MWEDKKTIFVRIVPSPESTQVRNSTTIFYKGKKKKHQNRINFFKGKVRQLIWSFFYEVLELFCGFATIIYVPRRSPIRFCRFIFCWLNIKKEKKKKFLFKIFFFFFFFFLFFSPTFFFFFFFFLLILICAAGQNYSLYRGGVEYTHTRLCNHRVEKMRFERTNERTA